MHPTSTRIGSVSLKVVSEVLSVKELERWVNGARDGLHHRRHRLSIGMTPGHQALLFSGFYVFR